MEFDCYITRLLIILTLDVSGLHQLKRFEYIKGVVLESRPFDIEDELVTATLKKKRNNLLKHYEVVGWKLVYFPTDEILQN